MDGSKTAMERAFELARSGRFDTVAHMKLELSKEGFRAEQVDGTSLSRQLRKIILSAKEQGTNAKGS